MSPSTISHLPFFPFALEQSFSFSHARDERSFPSTSEYLRKTDSLYISFSVSHLLSRHKLCLLRLLSHSVISRVLSDEVASSRLTSGTKSWSVSAINKFRFRDTRKLRLAIPRDLLRRRSETSDRAELHQICLVRNGKLLKLFETKSVVGGHKMWMNSQFYQRVIKQN